MRSVAAPELLIQVAHPRSGCRARSPPSVRSPLTRSKAITGAAHSSAGRYLGLTPDWLSTHQARGPKDIVDALMATASVPPFMPIGRVNDRAALDGGLVDNPPLTKLSAVEAAGGRALVLSTRSAAAAIDANASSCVRRSR